MTGRIIMLNPDGRICRNERELQAWAAKALGGTREVQCEHGRVDIVTATHAIECKFELGIDWKSALGQALFYADALGLKPGLCGQIDPTGGMIPSVVLRHADVYVCPDFLAMSSDRDRRSEVSAHFDRESRRW